MVRGNADHDALLASENDRLAEGLSHKMTHLKNIAIDIENEAKGHNKLLSGMDNEFDSSTGLLSGSVGRLGDMIKRSGNNRKIMCYLVLGLVLLFIIFYYFILNVKS